MDCGVTATGTLAGRLFHGREVSVATEDSFSLLPGPAVALYNRTQ